MDIREPNGQIGTIGMVLSLPYHRTLSSSLHRWPVTLRRHSPAESSLAKILKRGLPIWTAQNVIYRQGPWSSRHEFGQRLVFMPYLINTMGIDDRSVSKEFFPEITPRQKVFIDGMAPRPPDVSPDLPTGLRVSKPRQGGMPHILGWSLGPWIVSKRVKDIIDELEPGVHTSAPLTLIAEKTGKTIGTYYLLLATPIVDAIDPGHTDWHRGEPKQGLSFDGRIALKRSAIAGRHLWKLSAPLTQKYFGSDQLRERLLSEGLDGWRMERKCVVTNNCLDVL